MRIGLTTTSFRCDQGAERFVINLARGLLHAGHEVHVVGRLEKVNALAPFLDQLHPQAQKRFRFHRVKTIKASKYLNLITFTHGVHRHLKRLRLDVVQGFGKSLGLDVFRPHTGTHKSFMLSLAKKPSLEPCAYQEFAIEKRLLFEVAKAIVVNSRLSQNRLEAVYPGVPTPIRVIPNMVDFPYWQGPVPQEQGRILRRQWGIPEDGVVFLHVSTAFNYKGVPETLEALELLKTRLNDTQFRRIHLVLVGDSQYRPVRDLPERVRIFPRTHEIRPFYFASDVLLHPSHYDSYSNVVLEGLVCKKPVITSRQNGAMEAIDDGIDGRIIDQVKPALIADAMVALLDDTQRKSMSHAAGEKSLAFTPEAITNRYIDLYQELVEKYPNPNRDYAIKPWQAFISGAVKKDFLRRYRQKRNIPL